MAMFLVGKMYDEGRVFDDNYKTGKWYENYNKAGEWYEKAAAAGSEKAVEELKLRKKRMLTGWGCLTIIVFVIAGIIYWFMNS